jgi:hypothetical protein
LDFRDAIAHCGLMQRNNVASSSVTVAIDAMQQCNLKLVMFGVDISYPPM